MVIKIYIYKNKSYTYKINKNHWEDGLDCLLYINQLEQEVSSSKHQHS